MKTIKYKKNRHSILLTPCPNLPLFIIDGRPKVGSISCAECKYFVSDDPKKKTVTCKF